MTISAVGTQAGGSTVDSATAWTRAFGSNVTAGNLIIVSASKYDPTHTFVAGDCTQSAGTATIGTVSLDKVQHNTGGNNVTSAIWSAIVTGSGTCTMRVGSTAGTYFAAGSGEFSSTVGFDINRLETSGSATGSATTQTTGNLTSAGGALFFGCTSYDGSTNDTSISETAAQGWTRLYRETDASLHEPGVIFYQIVTVGTTKAVSSGNSNAWPYAIVGAVFKEGTGSPPATYAPPMSKTLAARLVPLLRF